MAKSIMIQGTMSNVGKSLITAGLCRIFSQDGYQTAPFKSQNMALNSYITEDGLEIGRAQAMQAEAAGKKPSVFMNPILLKPTTDTGSQVIINGKAIGMRNAWEYFQEKKKFLPEIQKAFHHLASEHDIIVIEGAGSPAEINLKENDIVNMGMAEIADCPVLLVGDIDRGGVFAQLAGTLLLLEEKERARIKGLIINKFRGDRAILEPGLNMLEQIAKKPVLGVVPYYPFDLEEEDSLSERFQKNNKKTEGFLHIAVIQVPKISNYTDFYPLERIEGITVNYIRHDYELEEADLIILPGSKSTITDLLWIREQGLENVIQKKAAEGAVIMGICGGYQMLGEEITDPFGVEQQGMVRGMGLLPVKTVYQSRKKTTQVKGKIEKRTGIWEALSNLEVSGYEIHNGRSSTLRENSFIRIFEQTNQEIEQRTDGCVCENIIGTYMHGIFENFDFTQRFLEILLHKKKQKHILLKLEEERSYKEQQYNKLADIIREAIEIDALYKMMGI